MKSFKIFSAVFLCITMFINICPARASDLYIYIESPSDLAELSKNCILDNYSKNKTAILKNDLDMSESDFSPIVFWGGTFDGNSHTIKGINIDLTDSGRGFMGTISENGVVKNLTLDIDIRYTKSSASVTSRVMDSITENGSDIFSLNRHPVKDKDSVSSIGGICGVNEGSVINCTVTGQISGDTDTGGIAGVNKVSGIIDGCTNHTEIQGIQNTGGIAGRNSGYIKRCTNKGKINPQPEENAQNTGGIAGLSYGAISDCLNSGEIGYLNTGYNTGGIAGKQSGYITSCENSGYIRGRKDIGGICGQFEPYTNIEFTGEGINAKVKETKSEIRSDLSDIQKNISARSDNIRDNLIAINNSAGTTPIQRALSNAGDYGILGSLLGTSGGINSGRIIEELEHAGDNTAALINGLYDINSSLDGFTELAESSDADTLRDNTLKISDSLVLLASSMAELADGATTDSKNLINSTTRLIDNINSRVDNADSETLDELSEVLTSLNRFINRSHLNVDLDLYQIERDLYKISQSANGTLKELTEPILKIAKDLNEIINLRNAALDELKQKIDEITGKIEPQEIGFLDYLFPSARAAEYSDTRSQLSDMNISDMDITIRRTVAGEETDAALIEYCINTGSVESLSDSGGICGCVGFDNSSRPEENFGISGDYSLNPATAVKAVINGSVNTGGITAKNTSAGGISGYSDIGTVKGCMNTGFIKVENGPYSGGICGYSGNNVKNCVNTGDLSAMRFIGGICGEGTNIECCLALTRVAEEKENTGAIAGLAQGDIKHNYFLKEKLAGINGIDYNDTAKSVTKEELLIKGSVPEALVGFSSDVWSAAPEEDYMPQLKALCENSASMTAEKLKALSSDASSFNFRVRFISDGEEIKSMHIKYGETIPEKDVPELKKRSTDDGTGGSYGMWDKDVTEPIIRPTDFSAVYNLSTSTISYGGEPAILLIEGNFRPDTELEVSVLNTSAEASYKFSVTEGGKAYKDAVTVRVHYTGKSKNIGINVLENGKNMPVKSERDGSYIKFEMSAPGTFEIVKTNNFTPVIIAIAAILLALAVIYIILKRRRLWKTKELQLLSRLKKAVTGILNARKG